jgi:hypothetical protein
MIMDFAITKFDIAGRPDYKSGSEPNFRPARITFKRGSRDVDLMLFCEFADLRRFRAGDLDTDILSVGCTAGVIKAL